jgi:hypothetical protein
LYYNPLYSKKKPTNVLAQVPDDVRPLVVQ